MEKSVEDFKTEVFILISLAAKGSHWQQRTQKRESEDSLRESATSDSPPIIKELKRTPKKVHRKNTRSAQAGPERNQRHDQSLWRARPEGNGAEQICIQGEVATWSHCRTVSLDRWEKRIVERDQESLWEGDQIVYA